MAKDLATERAAKFQAHLLDTIEQAVIATDMDGNITYWNKFAEKLYGWSKAEVLGRNILDVTPTNTTREQASEIMSHLLDGKSWSGEFLVQRKDGTTFPVMVTDSPVYDDDGRLIGLVGISFDLTERQRAEQIVRQERDFSEAVLNSLPGVFYLYDDNRKFQRWNKTFERVSGYAGAEIEAMHPLDFFTDAEKDLVASRIDEVFVKGESSVEADFVSKDGHKTPHYFTGVKAQLTEKPCLVGVGIDITDRRRAEEALRTRNNLYAMLSQTNRAVSVCRSRNELFSEVCSIAVETGKFRFAWIGVPDNNRMKMAASAGNDEGYMDNLVVTLDENDPRSFGPTGRAALTGSWFVVNDFFSSQMTTPWQENARRVGFAASAAFPLKERGQVAAVLTLYAAVPNFFTDDMVTTLSEITPAVSFALDAFAQEHERKQAEKARRVIEAHYRTLFEYAPDGILIADPESYYIDANASICQMLGYTRDELIGLHASDIVVPSEIQHIGQALSVIKSDHDYYREWQFRRKDGSVFPAEVIATKMPDGNLMGMIRDITERKQAEEKLRQSESQLAEAQHLARVGSWNLDVKNNILTWSDELCSILGIQPQEFGGKYESYLELVHPADREFVHESLQSSMKKLEPSNYYYRIIHPKDGTRIIHSRGHIISDENNNPLRMFGTAQDVTERKLAEERLKDSNEKLRALSARLQSVREAESIHIAREIHDDLGGALTGLKMDVSWLRKRLSESGNETLHQKLMSMSDLIDETVQKVRNICTELRPSILDDLGLAAAIEWQTREFQKRTEIECKIQSLEEELALSMEVSTAVFRIFQEILTNIARHSNATLVEINMQQRDNDLVLIVSDNGRGITETDIFETKSLGLLGMRERALVFGGKVEIKGTEGTGTTVAVSIPR